MSKGESGSRPRRTRRVFSPDFKQEAMRLMQERRKDGGSIAKVGRDLGVGGELLRRWERELHGPNAAPGMDAAPAGAQGVAPGAGDHAPGARFLKKSGGVLREGAAVKYACMARHQHEFNIRLMCRMLEVRSSGFYAWRARRESRRLQS